MNKTFNEKGRSKSQKRLKHGKAQQSYEQLRYFFGEKKSFELKEAYFRELKTKKSDRRPNFSD